MFYGRETKQTKSKVPSIFNIKQVADSLYSLLITIFFMKLTGTGWKQRSSVLKCVFPYGPMLTKTKKKKNVKIKKKN